MLHRDAGRKIPYSTVAGECSLVQPLWKSEWRVFRQLKTDVPYDPAIPLLGIYLKEVKFVYEKVTCNLILIAA